MNPESEESSLVGQLGKQKDTDLKSETRIQIQAPHLFLFKVREVRLRLWTLVSLSMK